MEIGEKIRSLRLYKKMTQAELAGDQITRNMLSLIENGSALPSIPTVMYLSDRLGVPVGVLLSRENEELFYKKLMEIPKIKQIYASGEYRLCYDICTNLSDDQLDDEICLILSKCCFFIAKESFYLGKLHQSVRFFDKACEYSQRSIYDGSQMLSMISIYFEYLLRLSPSLASENGNEAYQGPYLCADSFGRYALVIKGIESESENSECVCPDIVTEKDNGFYDHIKAKIKMVNGDYVSARNLLKKLINSDVLDCRVVMYDIFKDLETCCRETEDYKGAYEYSVGKVELLEHMLREDNL